MLTTYDITPYGLTILLSLTPDVSESEALQFARDLNAGFRITLPTGVDVAYSGNWPTPYTVWPVKATTQLSSLSDD